MTRILYQFPLSHYCEKARWLLDFKKLDYEVHNLFPGPHRLFTRWHTRTDSVPMLRDGKDWLGDSTEMAFHLEARYPQFPLLPADPLLRSRTAMLEEMADEAGEHVRRWVYSEVIDLDATRDAMIGSFVWARPYQELIWAGFKRGVFKMYRINPVNAQKSLEKLLAAMTLLEEALLANGGRYLVGNSLTLADIAAASLFAPLLSVPGSPWEAITERSPLFQQVYDDILRRPFGQWILRLYAEERDARGNWAG